MKCLTILAILAVATGAVAFDLGNRAPAKPARTVDPPPADPDVLRQGGDTILEAVLIPVPLADQVGTTTGYDDDYDEVCPYTGSTSPDVVYRFVPDHDAELDFDMLGSAYDTKIYVYSQNLELLACNDDFWPDYTSRIERLPVTAGEDYFLVCDGYGGDFGEYLLNITEWEPCLLDCPLGGVLEEEPPLAVDYVDTFNGGCNTDAENPPFQPVTDPIFCGVSGWYLNQGATYRDTDWFIVTLPGDGVLEITGDAEERCYMFELGPQDCGSVDVVQNVEIGSCDMQTMVITGAPGSDVWFWVGPATFDLPPGEDVYEFDYYFILGIIESVENHTLSDVKALFD
jgi:hypothetical protein